MRPFSRREILKLSGAAAAGVAMGKTGLRAAAAPSPWTPPSPETEPLPVKGYHLRLTRGEMELGGKKTGAIFINGQSPGPELRFREGDLFRVTVENLIGHDTGVHWHGLLVPNHEDGVPDVTQPPQANNSAITYSFPLAQSGTYWYHSHHGLDEQIGLAGPLTIEPRMAPRDYDRDVTLFFEDRADVPPEQILAALRGENAPAAARAIVQRRMGMGMMGGGMMNAGSGAFISDINYPFFLLNGKLPPAPFIIRARTGERLRLRFINGSAASYFRAQLDGHPFSIIAKDGNDVVPVAADNFAFGTAERYDAIVTVGAPGAYRLAASALGQNGGAVAWLLVGDAKLPDDAGYATPPWGQRMLDYSQLRAPASTALPAGPVKKFQLVLGGGMMDYVWTINGQTLEAAAPLLIHEGDVVQLELANATMMAHPMHLHGHFFRVVDSFDQPDPNAPLMDTVSVPSRGIVNLEFAANNPGVWFFHCHILYHLASGMARLFRYTA